MTIDLNSDLGGGYGAWTMGDDQALLDFVSSANIACGFHAGAPPPCAAPWNWPQNAASPSARTSPTPTDAASAATSSTSQPIRSATTCSIRIGALEAFARSAGTRVSYVKPHGAL